MELQAHLNQLGLDNEVLTIVQFLSETCAIISNDLRHVIQSQLTYYTQLHQLILNANILFENSEFPQQQFPFKYTLCVSLINGSENSFSTIFSIFEDNFQDQIFKGTKIILAGYVFYGSSTQFILAYDQKVHLYQLNPIKQKFLNINTDLQVPQYGNSYSIDHGNTIFWDEPTSKYVSKKIQNNVQQLNYNSIIPYIHTILFKGGILLQPENQKHPDGNLSLLFEAFPISFIIESSGGKSFNQDKRLLLQKCHKIDQKCGIITGSSLDVKEYQSYFQNDKKNK